MANPDREDSGPADPRAGGAEILLVVAAFAVDSIPGPGRRAAAPFEGEHRVVELPRQLVLVQDGRGAAGLARRGRSRTAGDALRHLPS